MADWRLAQSLVTLRSQVNELFPNRSKVSDGTIGDLAHQERASDHNPDAYGVVAALDLTHDPEHGLDIADLARALTETRDPRIKYVITNGRIWTPAKNWQTYTGTTDPHYGHLHISVNQANYDEPQKWELKGGNMASQADLDLALYRLSESEKALRAREQQALELQGQIDLLKWQLSESDKALRSREAQADALTAEINSLKAQVGDVDANLLGQALIKLLQTFGYKKG